MTSVRRNRSLAVLLVLVALVFAALAVFYFTQDTTFLASPPPRIQLKHGLVSLAVAIIALLAANILWRRRV
jgi:hypothetical protein